MKKLIILLLAIPALSFAQTVYKVEKNGVITYSNSPISGGVKVSLPEISLVPAVTKSNDRRIDLPVPVGGVSTPTPGLLPPPPPALGNSDNIKPVEPKAESRPEQVKSDSAPKRETNLAEAKLNLAKAKNLLSSQEGVRNGDERNYQKYLDRIKPFQDEVLRLEAEVARLEKK